MTGTTMSELYEYLAYRREVEFVHNKEEFAIQPEFYDGKYWLVIWNITNEP